MRRALALPPQCVMQRRTFGEVEAMDAELECESRPKRSLNAEFSTVVNFHNKSSRRVQVIWLDYQGQPVWYRDLRPGKAYSQQTYVTHPWMCVESDSGRFEEMLVNSQRVLYPEKNHITANITERQKTLYERCLRDSSREVCGKVRSLGRKACFSTPHPPASEEGHTGL